MYVSYSRFTAPSQRMRFARKPNIYDAKLGRLTCLTISRLCSCRSGWTESRQQWWKTWKTWERRGGARYCRAEQVRRY